MILHIHEIYCINKFKFKKKKKTDLTELIILIISDFDWPHKANWKCLVRPGKYDFI
jgi:hypothetical protein